MRVPGAAPAGGDSGSTTSCASLLAASSMPKLLMPLMLRGLHMHMHKGQQHTRGVRGQWKARMDLHRHLAAFTTLNVMLQSLHAVKCHTQDASAQCHLLDAFHCLSSSRPPQRRCLQRTKANPASRKRQSHSGAGLLTAAILQPPHSTAAATSLLSATHFRLHRTTTPRSCISARGTYFTSLHTATPHSIQQQTYAPIRQ